MSLKPRVTVSADGERITLPKALFERLVSENATNLELLSNIHSAGADMLAEYDNLQATNEELHIENEELSAENQALREEIDELRYAVSGRAVNGMTFADEGLDRHSTGDSQIIAALEQMFPGSRAVRLF